MGHTEDVNLDATELSMAEFTLVPTALARTAAPSRAPTSAVRAEKQKQGRALSVGAKVGIGVSVTAAVLLLLFGAVTGCAPPRSPKELFSFFLEYCEGYKVGPTPKPKPKQPSGGGDSEGRAEPAAAHKALVAVRPSPRPESAV